MMKKNKTANNANKKLITFKNVDLINGYLQDRAFVSDSSCSAVIEKILLKEFLPESKTSAHYIETIYKYGLKQTFMELMQYLCAGINLKASQKNAYEIVKLGMNIVSRPIKTHIDPEHENLWAHHFMSSCESVRNKIEHERKEKTLSFDEEQRFRCDIELLGLKDQLDFVPYNYFELVLANWDILGDYTFTFRLLYDVVALSDPALWERAEHRLKAIDCITDVTATWEAYI